MGVPVDSLDGSLSPLEFTAMTRTVYSVPLVRPVIVSLYRVLFEVD